MERVTIIDGSDSYEADTAVQYSDGSLALRFEEHIVPLPTFVEVVIDGNGYDEAFLTNVTEDDDGTVVTVQL